MLSPLETLLIPTHGEAAPFDARPVYRIAVFGLGHRFQRLLEIIVKHARHNNYRYQVAEHSGPGEFDIALVDMTAKGGAEVAQTLKSVPLALPVIGVGRRASHHRGNDDLLLATFSLDVLGVLNRAAESLSMRERTRRMSTRFVQADPTLRLPLVSGRPPRTLVVEPSPAVRSQIAAALRQIAVDSEGVGTLAQAEEVLSMRSYELVILEPQQPDGDGLAMLRRLRSETGRLKLVVPVIVLSSRSGVFDLARASWAGCNGYLGKPVPLSALHTTVNRVLRRFLGRRPQAPRLPRDAAAPRTLDSALAAMDLQEALRPGTVPPLSALKARQSPGAQHSSDTGGARPQQRGGPRPAAPREPDVSP